MLKVSIHVCDERVLASPKAGNIGVLFDESLNKIPQVTAKCKSAFHHLRKISIIRRHLTQVSFMQQKVRVLHKTFSYGKNSTLIYGTYVGPVSLLFLLNLTRSFTESTGRKIGFTALLTRVKS